MMTSFDSTKSTVSMPSHAQRLGETVSPYVEIIVLNWNGWRDTIKCVRSLKELDYPRYTITVVDNNSTNDSVKQIRKAFPDIHLIETGHNGGFGAGNNVAIRQALASDTKYVWLVNNDATVETRSLRVMMDIAETDEKVGVVGSVLRDEQPPHEMHAWGGGRLIGWTGQTLDVHGPTDNLDYLIGASMLLRCDALTEIGLFDERFFMFREDVDISLRLKKAGWKLAVAEGSILYHHRGGSLANLDKLVACWNAEGLVLLARKHTPCPIIPALVGLVIQSGGKILRGRWKPLLGTWQGWLRGWRHRDLKRKPGET